MSQKHIMHIYIYIHTYIHIMYIYIYIIHHIHSNHVYIYTHVTAQYYKRIQKASAYLKNPGTIDTGDLTQKIHGGLQALNRTTTWGGLATTFFFIFVHRIRRGIQKRKQNKELLLASPHDPHCTV